jgi:hypothetical protein
MRVSTTGDVIKTENNLEAYPPSPQLESHSEDFSSKSEPMSQTYKESVDHSKENHNAEAANNDSNSTYISSKQNLSSNCK